jgi:hypothetical protein
MDHEMKSEVKNLVYWRRAVSMSVLVDAGSVLGLVNAPNAEHPIAVVRVFSIAWSTAILVALMVLRRKPSIRGSQAAFALAPIPLFPTWWLLVGERTLHNLPMEAFMRQEIVCMVYALATPPSPAISLALIAAFSIDALALLWWLGPHSHLIAAQAWQPWTILLYGAFSAGLAVYQARGQRRLVALIAHAEHADAMKRLVRAYLAVRDMVNTPLQTLKISASLLASRCQDAGDLPGTIARSVDRIDQLNDVFRTEASGIEWTPGEESFDPIQVLNAHLPGAK